MTGIIDGYYDESAGLEHIILTFDASGQEEEEPLRVPLSDELKRLRSAQSEHTRRVVPPRRERNRRVRAELHSREGLSLGRRPGAGTTTAGPKWVYGTPRRVTR